MAARTKKIGVTVLKVIKPNHFLIQEIPGLNMSQSAQKFLELESNYLNQFDLLDVIPKVFQYPIKGSVVLVKTEEDAVWYRGKVITVLETSKGARVSIFLVDYGRIVAVSKEWIRKIPNEYLDVPFQALDFVLPNIQPSSLIFDDELILHRGPSEKWDTAATEEIRRIVKVGITGEAFVDHEDVNGVYYGKLQINSGGEKMCLNQYLLDRNFACHLNLGQNIDTGSRIKKVSDKILFWEDSRETNSLSPHQPSSSITGRTSRASRGRATPVESSLENRYCSPAKSVDPENNFCHNSGSLNKTPTVLAMGRGKRLLQVIKCFGQQDLPAIGGNSSKTVRSAGNVFGGGAEQL